MAVSIPPSIKNLSTLICLIQLCVAVVLSIFHDFEIILPFLVFFPSHKLHAHHLTNLSHLLSLWWVCNNRLWQKKKKKKINFPHWVNRAEGWNGRRWIVFAYVRRFFSICQWETIYVLIDELSLKGPRGYFQRELVGNLGLDDWDPKEGHD